MSFLQSLQSAPGIPTGPGFWPQYNHQPGPDIWRSPNVGYSAYGDQPQLWHHGSQPGGMSNSGGIASLPSTTEVKSGDPIAVFKQGSDGRLQVEVNSGLPEDNNVTHYEAQCTGPDGKISTMRLSAWVTKGVKHFDMTSSISEAPGNSTAPGNLTTPGGGTTSGDASQVPVPSWAQAKNDWDAMCSTQGDNRKAIFAARVADTLLGQGQFEDDPNFRTSVLTTAKDASEAMCAVGLADEERSRNVVASLDRNFASRSRTNPYNIEDVSAWVEGTSVRPNYISDALCSQPGTVSSFVDCYAGLRSQHSREYAVKWAASMMGWNTGNPNSFPPSTQPSQSLGSRIRDTLSRYNPWSSRPPSRSHPSEYYSWYSGAPSRYSSDSGYYSSSGPPGSNSGRHVRFAP